MRQPTHPTASNAGEAALPSNRGGEVDAGVVQVQATPSQQGWGHDWSAFRGRLPSEAFAAQPMPVLGVW
jgi:hypothetical protein